MSDSIEIETLFFIMTPWNVERNIQQQLMVMQLRFPFTCRPSSPSSPWHDFLNNTFLFTADNRLVSRCREHVIFRLIFFAFLNSITVVVVAIELATTRLGLWTRGNFEKIENSGDEPSDLPGPTFFCVSGGRSVTTRTTNGSLRPLALTAVTWPT
jgi:hypothetical protein